MKSRNFNLGVLLVLLVVTAVVVSSQSQREKMVDDSVSESRLDDRTHSRRENMDAGSIVSSTTLPKVAVGAFLESYGFIRGSYSADTGFERPATYVLTERKLVESDWRTEIPIANPVAGHFSGLAYDPTQNRLIVSSLGGVGYLDFYDLERKKWLNSVSLENKDVEAITFWEDQICGIEKVGGEETVNTLVFFDSEGNFKKKLELSFPVIAPGPRLGDQEGQLVLYSSIEPKLAYQINPESGEVTGNFRQGYEGTPASLVAVYEASDDHDSLGTLEVTVDSLAPSILILSAYEGVHWKISGGEHLTKVIVNGYDKPEISGLPENCEVAVLSYETSGKYLPFAHEIQSQEMCLLLSKLEQQGIGVKSIAAGYQAKTAIVR